MRSHLKSSRLKCVKYAFRQIEAGARLKEGAGCPGFAGEGTPGSAPLFYNCTINKGKSRHFPTSARAVTSLPAARWKRRGRVHFCLLFHHLLMFYWWRLKSGENRRSTFDGERPSSASGDSAFRMYRRRSEISGSGAVKVRSQVPGS